MNNLSARGENGMAAEFAEDYALRIVQTVREPLLVLDSSLRVMTANRAFFKVFGVSGEDTEGRLLYELGNGQWDIPRLRNLLEEILPRNTEFEDFEVEHVYPEIGRKVMLLNARRVEGASSARILLAIEDITERKRTEEKLKFYAARLERSNLELQDFAQVASHDLQEPLRKIQAFGDRLMVKAGDKLTGDAGEYLRRMLNAASRMQSLINDLLAFSRVATNGRPFVKVDLGLVARDVVSDLESSIEVSGGRVEVGEMVEVEADTLQMRQLLQNLIGNALKYRREGTPPVVEVTARVLEERRQVPRDADVPAGLLCQIMVKDNGIGFDEKYLDRIFTVFQRLHGRGEYDGTGVGLAVCRKIAERHGGSITARSRPGEGATFIVTLPLVRPSREVQGGLNELTAEADGE